MDLHKLKIYWRFVGKYKNKYFDPDENDIFEEYYKLK